MRWPRPSDSVLHHEVAGSGPQVIVALHGLGSDHRQAFSAFSSLGREHWRIIAPDLRAHGRTQLEEATGQLTITRLAEDVEDLLRALRAPWQVHLLGISLGAAVATELLARAKLAISSALLIRPAWSWTPYPPNLAVFTEIADLLIRYGPTSGAQRFRRTAACRRIEATSPSAARALLRQFTAPQARARAVRLTALPRSAPHKPTQRPPVTVLTSSLDPVHPVGIARELARDLDGRLLKLPPRYAAPNDHQLAMQRVVADWATDIPNPHMRP